MAGGRWDDLTTRVATGLAVAVAGIGAIWAGGWFFIAICAAAGAAMVWELVRLMRPQAGQMAVWAALVALAGIAFFGIAPGFMAVGLMICGLLLGGWQLSGASSRIFYAYGLFLLAGVLGMMLLRDQGALPVLWLVLVVIASDIGGYFGGRLMGGPKFWPRVSPKKTWSGTITGWVLAAAVGAVVARYIGGGAAVMATLSVLLALAAQMGDIAESAIKRRQGVKDASDLLPGHGGVLDRFDAMIAAFALALPVVLLFPGLFGQG